MKKLRSIPNIAGQRFLPSKLGLNYFLKNSVIKPQETTNLKVYSHIQEKILLICAGTQK